MFRFTTLMGLLLTAVWCLPAWAQQERFAATPDELSAAIAASEPGDTVVMANGRWTDVGVRFYAQGAVGDTITLKAETPGQVILDGRSTLRIGGDYLKVDGLWFDRGALASGHVVEFRQSSSNLANHSRLTNCAITDYNPPSKLTEYKWVSVYGTHNRVDHCYFAGKTHDGATLVVWLRDPPNDEPGYHRIDHNHFGPRPELGKNGGETIRIGTSSRSMQESFVTVEHNLFEECDGEIEIISNKTGQNTFRHNTFRRSAGTLTLRHGNDAHVYGNFFFGDNKSETGGVRVIGERHEVYNNYFENLRGTGYRAAISVMNGVPDSPLNRYFQVKDAVIANNTIVEVNEAFVIGAGKDSEKTLPPENLTLANNLVWTDEGPLVEYEDMPVSVTYTSNLMFGADLGIDPPEGITQVDPELVQADGLWRPGASSPALSAGTPLALVALDIEGQPRAETPDLGADERSDEPALYAPLDVGDVGPDWLSVVLPNEAPTSPATFAVTNAPNPFRTHTTLSFELDRPAHVRLVVYDVLGRQVARLLDTRHASGAHRVAFVAADLAAGLYLAVLDVDGQRHTHTLVRQ